MPALNQTHEEIHARLFTLHDLHDAQREAIFELIQQLNSQEDWYPEAFRRHLKTLQEQGVIVEPLRHKLEAIFFPGHGW